MRNLLLSTLLLASAFQTAMGQTTVGAWTYIVENGGATIKASTATGAVTIPSVLNGVPVRKVGDDRSGPIFGYPNLSVTSITIPNSVTSIGNSAFYGCTSLVNVYLPTRFTNTYPYFELTASQVSFYDTTSPSYLMGQQSVISNPSAHNLYTATQHTANFNAGKDSVLNSPNSNGLYTTSQIQNMAVGDLVLTKNVAGSFTLNYDIEQSTDLQTWTPYQALSLPLTGLPADKAFVRIKPKQ